MSKKSKPKAYVVDLDDVLVKFCATLCEVAEEFGITGYKETDLRQWDLPEDLNEILDIHYELIYAIAEPFECAAEAIRRAYSEGKKIIFLTARHSDPNSIRATKHNLDINGLPYHELLFEEDKVAAMKLLLNKYDVEAFFDDKVDTINKMCSVLDTSKIYLINRPTNAKRVLNAGVNVIDCICEAEVINE
jgi:uncharacterized HAD superfamily protein